MSLWFLSRLKNKSITARILHFLFTLKLFLQTRRLAKEADKIKQHRHPWMIIMLIYCILTLTASFLLFTTASTLFICLQITANPVESVLEHTKERKGGWNDEKPSSQSALKSAPRRKCGKRKKRHWEVKGGVFAKSAAPLKDTAVCF